MSFMDSMYELMIISRWRRIVAMLMLLQMWSYNRSAAVTVPIDSIGGLPSQIMSNSSSTGLSLSNGKLTLNSTKASFVYALFPYIPFNSSEPSMGSFNTYFNFSNASSAGALAFIAINPNSDIMSLEDRLRAISNLDYVTVNTSRKNHSNYLAVVYNFTAATPQLKAGSVALGIRDDPVYVVSNTYSVGDRQAREFSGQFQYINPASLSESCPISTAPGEEVLNNTDTACPANSLEFGVYYMPSGYAMFSASNPHSNFSLSVSSLVGFFAFGGGVFDVSFWQFTTLDTNDNVVLGTTETILIASSVSNSPHPSSMLNLMISLLLFFYI